MKYFYTRAGLALAAVLAFAGLPMLSGHLFAALATEDPVKTWQKVDMRIADATPAAQSLFRAFKSFLMQQRGAVRLQYIAFGDMTVDVNPLDGALRVYAVYLKKQDHATDAFFKIFDDAADDATAGDAVMALMLPEALRETMAFYPDGLPLAAGLVAGSYTAFIGANGVTATTTLQGPQGFMLVGGPSAA